MEKGFEEMVFQEKKKRVWEVRVPRSWGTLWQFCEKGVFTRRCGFCEEKRGSVRKGPFGETKRFPSGESSI